MEFHFLSYLEQVKQLTIAGGTFPANVLNTHLPLVHTLQRLDLTMSTFSWMLGRTFKILTEVQLHQVSEEWSAHRGLRVDLPACTTLKSKDCSVIHLGFISSPNLQILVWEGYSKNLTRNNTPLQKFLLNCSYLQRLEVVIHDYSVLHSFFQFVFCDAREQNVWQGIAEPNRPQ